MDNARAREGRARLGEINRAINLAIRPMSDLAQYGAIDVWSSPLVTFASGAGDCEDYAIAKFVALRQAGISPDDLRIVIMRDTIRGEDHAVAAARLDGHWLTLDNRRMAMVEDAHVRNYRPLFFIDQYGVMQYVDDAIACRTAGPGYCAIGCAECTRAAQFDLALQPGRGLIRPVVASTASIACRGAMRTPINSSHMTRRRHLHSVRLSQSPVPKVAVAGTLHDGLRAHELYVGTKSLGHREIRTADQ